MLYRKKRLDLDVVVADMVFLHHASLDQGLLEVLKLDRKSVV